MKGWADNIVRSIDGLGVKKGARPRKFKDLKWQGKKGDPWFDTIFNDLDNVYGIIHVNLGGALGLSIKIGYHGDEYIMTATVVDEDGGSRSMIEFEETIGDEGFLCDRIVTMVKGLSLLIGE